jgi:hypothetical protein
MQIYYKKKIIQQLTYTDGDFSVSWSDMERHIETSTYRSGNGYFKNFPYPKERDSRIDEYLIKKGVAIRNRDGDLETTPKTSKFIETILNLLN